MHYYLLISVQRTRIQSLSARPGPAHDILRNEFIAVAATDVFIEVTDPTTYPRYNSRRADRENQNYIIQIHAQD